MGVDRDKGEVPVRAPTAGLERATAAVDRPTDSEVAANYARIHLGWRDIVDAHGRCRRSGLPAPFAFVGGVRLSLIALDPGQSVSAARKRQREATGMRLLLDAERSDTSSGRGSAHSEGKLPSLVACLAELEDLRESLGLAARGGLLSEVELVGVAELLRFGASLQRAAGELEHLLSRGMLRVSSDEMIGFRSLFSTFGQLRAAAWDDRASDEARAELCVAAPPEKRDSNDLRDQFALEEVQEPHQDQAELSRMLLQPSGLLERLDRSLDRSGEFPVIADDATPELARARAAARKSRRHAQELAERLVKSSSMGSVLQDRFWTEREGRFVIPVRSDAWGALSDETAIIHAVSTRRSTLFVEPSVLLGANNELARAKVAVRSEEERVLRELSAAIGQVAPALAGLQSIAWLVDVLQATCELANRMSAWMPTLMDVVEADARTDLKELRHPSMVAAQASVIGNDVRLDLGQTLIVSGPNAGGKTVFLKALGLAVLMARAGLAIPTRFPGAVVAYEHVVTDVGDDQSISGNLSTFTAHLGHVGRALRLSSRAPERRLACDLSLVDGEASETKRTAGASRGHKVLVLLDEIAVGTEPKQGAALAQSILLELADLGASGVVTTHYDTLKELAFNDRRFANAAVGFDVEAMAPTFRVTLGVPGASAALAVARRVGMDARILERAASLLSDEDRRIDAMLSELAAKRASLEADLAAAQEQLRKSRKQAEELALTQRRIAEGIRGQRARAHEQATRELRDLEAELRRYKRALREVRQQDGSPNPAPQPHEFSGSEPHKVAQAAQDRLDQLALRAEPVPGKVPRVLAPGDIVCVAALNQTGEVVALKGTRVSVQLAGLRTTVEISELRVDSNPTHDRSRPEAAATSLGGPATRTGLPAKPKIKPAKGTPIFPSRSRAARIELSSAVGASRDSGDPRFERSDYNTVDLRGERADVAVARLEDFLGIAMGLGEPEVHVIHGHGTGSVRKAIRGRLRDLGHVRRFDGGTLEQGGDGVTVVWLQG